MSSDNDKLLEVKGLKTHFFTDEGVVKAVDGISFDLGKGEVLGLVGESGSGKSVSALSMLRLIPNPPGRIVAGEIHFNGRDLLRISEDEMRHIRGNEIAMIFQEPMTSLNPVLTVGRQVAEPLEVHQNATRSEALTRAVELLDQVHIADAGMRVHAYPHQFSGGMRQRAMIAMGMGCDPLLMIADEPTTALDVTVQTQLLDLLQELTRTTGMSLIIITHNLGVVARYADRVNVMYAGRIVESGPADDIYEDPRHPYTIGLMASVPQLDQDVRQRLVPIEGQPPDLSDLPGGCSFHPRCPYATDQCRGEAPELRADDGNDAHAWACWIDVRH
ncbi:MAG: ABC transporter ATP-binding protein [Proteobacteria bacterium]|nr:ABC transporter ATP-binding protein [Pseudomonadota bacterium]MDA1302381.1 ABC transporter ATP-binding protein [Pseudomonadota bacterium]